MIIVMLKHFLTRSDHLLPFDKLSPSDFERLCLWLITREGYSCAEHLGASGADRGRDILAYCDEKRIVFQCKRVKRFTTKDCLAEISKILAASQQEYPDEIHFILTCNVSLETRRLAREASSKPVHFCALTELDERTRRHRDIVQAFFHMPSADGGSGSGATIDLSIQSHPDVQSRLLESISDQEALRIMVAAHQLRGSYAAAFSDDVMWGEKDNAFLRLTYSHRRAGQTLIITPNMPYLKMARSGVPVCGLDYFHRPFEDWRGGNNHYAVTMAITVHNPTSSELFITEAEIDVCESLIDRTPVLVVHDDIWNIGAFDIQNFGWGNVLSPKLRFSITSLKQGWSQGIYKPPEAVGEVHELLLEDFAESCRINVLDRLPKGLLVADCAFHAITGAYVLFISVFGELSYRIEGDDAEHFFRFVTRVNLRHPGPGAPADASHRYDVFLKAGELGKVAFPLHQRVAANSNEFFLIRVSCDKSATFQTRWTFNTSSGNNFEEAKVNLNIFRPRIKVAVDLAIGGKVT